jgi:ubiquinone/menaquinone biosynthesis C-methylase UbiE
MDQLLNIMRALADPTRLRIALLIRQLELSVGELVQILGQSQPRVSRHIRILDESGIAERRKEGSWVFLRPGLILTSGLIDGLLELANPLNSRATQRDLAKLQEVRTTRAEQAARYFAEHAHSWDELRNLHISDSEVETAMQQILATAPIGRVLDVGTGTGRMMELFAAQSTKFTAIDNNFEMLRIARSKLADIDYSASEAGAQKPTIEIMLGDFNQLPLADNSYDTILFHQVLHYAQAPENVIAEAARVLAPGGRIIIVDFAPHNHEELRSVHAHARLGFEDATIAAAFEANALHNLVQLPLDGGELIVKIWVGQKAAMNDRAIINSPSLSSQSAPPLRSVTNLRINS